MCKKCVCSSHKVMTANFGTVYGPRPTLAEQLFFSDPDVRTFAIQKAESPEGVNRILAKMWEIDQSGWRSKCEARAALMQECTTFNG